jgi:hypothetical protein
VQLLLDEGRDVLDPVSLAVPESSPDGLSVMPEGGEPSCKANEYGSVPPFAVSWRL